MNWAEYPNFTEAEFRCSHTGECRMNPGTLARLQRLRTLYGKPMRITSGYRHPTHPIEARKAEPGVHATGHAVDVGVRGADALRLVQLALDVGFTGIGVSQKGDTRFIHLDDVLMGFPRPMIWSY